jgi:hypothetical protein
MFRINNPTAGIRLVRKRDNPVSSNPLRNQMLLATTSIPRSGMIAACGRNKNTTRKIRITNAMSKPKRFERTILRARRKSWRSLTPRYEILFQKLNMVKQG